MSLIGCDKLHYAIMANEDNETYSTPKETIHVKSVDINPTVNTANNYYNDALGETSSTLGAITVTINTADLTKAELADLLGATVDSKGVLIQSSNDSAPYVAVIFRSMKSDEENYRYVCLYKGKFSLPQENYTTKGENIAYQDKQIVGTFMPLKKYINNKRQWKATVDSDDTTAGISTVIADWFKAPYGETTV